MHDHDLMQSLLVDLACPDGPIVDMIGKPALFGACSQMGLEQPRTIRQLAVENITLGHFSQLFQLSDRQLLRLSRVGEMAIQRIRKVEAYFANGELWIVENRLNKANTP